MRLDFEKALRAYATTARLMMDESTTSTEKAAASAAKKHIQTERTREAGTNEKSEERIYEIERKKQRIMARLRMRLRELENPFNETIEVGSKVSYVGGRLRCNGRVMDVGSLLTDGEWGVTYAPDASVPLDLRRMHAIEEADRKIRELLDRQILVDALEGNRLQDETREEAYREIQEKNEKGEVLAAGVIAEKMVRNFLKKLTLNHELDFDIVPADVHEDVELKMDFKIRRRARSRGVQVDRQTEAMGVQFTIKSSDSELDRKRRQIAYARRDAIREAHVDDVVLVQVPLRQVTEMYQRWKKSGSPPGGPEQLWDDATREQIFRGALKGFFTENDINDRWAQVRGEKKMERMAA